MNKINIALIIIILLIFIFGLVYFLWPKAAPAPINNEVQNNTQTNNQQTMETTTPNTAPESLKIETTQEGTGEGAKTGDKVTVNYTGKLASGTVFDSSLGEGRTPFEFTLGENSVIEGWELGIMGMKTGEKRTLTIPAELGYGSAGAGGGLIPPNATLIFDVELLKIN